MESYFKLEFIEKIIGYIILGVVVGVPILFYIIDRMMEIIEKISNKE